MPINVRYWGQSRAQPKALARAEQIRAYVDAVRSRVADSAITPDDFEGWAAWARAEADRIDPVKNGTIGQAVAEHSPRAADV